ncbi:MAG TPA: divalent-cation tolerance protein CutA [Oleiagrimonas sp.]|nr:divalent-cation tolerance protein CutA [Oleiagrimonas sp.]
MPDTLLALCTCPDDDSAARLARTLVGEHLAACVSRVPGLTSVYAWQGQIEEDTEVLLLIKTTAERFAALRERLLALHPYAVPELIALDIRDGLPAYLEWLQQAVAVDHS